jgi:hypothetical protein
MISKADGETILKGLTAAQTAFVRSMAVMNVH